MRDASNATFTIARPGGDVLGPLVVPGSIVSAPNPIVRPNAAALSATARAATTGGGTVVAAEWSYGPTAAGAGAGTPLLLGGGTVTRALSGTLDTTPFGVGPRTLWVRAQDASGNWGPAARFDVQVNGPDPVGVGEVPAVAFLDQNAPNPFAVAAGPTAIRFGLPRAARAELAVYDVQGRRVKQLAQGVLEAGRYSAAWDGRDERGARVAAGVYYYALRADGGLKLEKRLIVLP
jgi:hypothetical protein